MNQPVLRVENLHAGYVAGAPVVHGVSLELRPGEVLAVFGPNGAGKSTLVRAIAGTARLFAGRVRCGGREVAALPSWQIARAGIGFVPQRANVFTEMTVRENLELGHAGRRNPSAHDQVEVEKLFPELAERQATRVGALSGGQRQMVAIARALLAGPDLLILDEPSAGLAPNLVGSLFSLLATLKARLPILLVEQNVKAAMAIADRAMLLAEGRLLREGTSAELLSDPVLAGAFLGALAS